MGVAFGQVRRNLRIRIANKSARRVYKQCGSAFLVSTNVSFKQHSKSLNSHAVQ